MKSIIWLLLFIPFTLAGQRYIGGRITDAASGEPIVGASVFFSGTTSETSTDSEGNYRLQMPEEGSYRLMISHVGYQSIYKDIEARNISEKFDAFLQIQELEEVTIAARVRFRRTDINLFWRKILGTNPSRRTIQATNPEAVYYYYNPETRILKVTSREPLQIVNYETGYHIHCELNHYTHDYNTGNTDWGFQCVFTELEPKNSRQKNSWETKRKEVYNVSLTKFIKSLYNNTLNEDGYVLADFRFNPDPFNPFHLSILTSDSILSTVSDNNSKTLNLSSPHCSFYPVSLCTAGFL